LGENEQALYGYKGSWDFFFFFFFFLLLLFFFPSVSLAAGSVPAADAVGAIPEEAAAESCGGRREEKMCVLSSGRHTREKRIIIFKSEILQKAFYFEYVENCWLCIDCIAHWDRYWVEYNLLIVPFIPLSSSGVCADRLARLCHCGDHQLQGE